MDQSLQLPHAPLLNRLVYCAGVSQYILRRPSTPKLQRRPLSVPIAVQFLLSRDAQQTWLAIFAALVAGQGAYLLEHVAQMIQIHVLKLSGAQAQGIVGALNIEWVHFLWNTWVIVMVVVMLWRFPGNALSTAILKAALRQAPSSWR